MTNLLIMLTLPEKVRNKYYAHLKAKFPGVNINMVDHHSKVGPYIGDADALVTFGAHMSDDVLKKGTRLKWVQAVGTGVDGIIGEPSLRGDVLVTNMHGNIMADSMSEAAIMLMLALSRGLPRAIGNQGRRKWDRWPASLLNGKTVGIFGVGAIAADLAPKCKAFGMKVVGISSAVRNVPGFDRMCNRDELEQAVRDVDYLVLLTPYTPETHGIVNAKVFAAMKPSSFLFNLARGGVVDEDALLAALQSGKIAGAGLDVFAREPLREEHPFWTMENVIVTPHLGGFHDQYAERALPTIESNLRRFLAGDTQNMINVVRRPAGA
jgi:phosphoglycerate dehydrogenase-like enzyme